MEAGHYLRVPRLRLKAHSVGYGHFQIFGGLPGQEEFLMGFAEHLFVGKIAAVEGINESIWKKKTDTLAGIHFISV